MCVCVYVCGVAILLTSQVEAHNFILCGKETDTEAVAEDDTVLREHVMSKCKPKTTATDPWSKGEQPVGGARTSRVDDAEVEAMSRLDFTTEMTLRSLVCGLAASMSDHGTHACARTHTRTHAHTHARTHAPFTPDPPPPPPPPPSRHRREGSDAELPRSRV